MGNFAARGLAKGAGKEEAGLGIHLELDGIPEDGPGTRVQGDFQGQLDPRALDDRAR